LWVLRQEFRQRRYGVIIGAGVEEQLERVEMAVGPGTVQHGLSANSQGVHVGAVRE
jgi:hypothetical protein